MSRNSVRLTLEEFLERDGRSLNAILQDVVCGDENAPALCNHGCEVEPDGTCPHVCPSILLAAGLI